MLAYFTREKDSAQRTLSKVGDMIEFPWLVQKLSKILIKSGFFNSCTDFGSDTKDDAIPVSIFGNTWQNKSLLKEAFCPKGGSL